MIIRMSSGFAPLRCEATAALRRCARHKAERPLGAELGSSLMGQREILLNI
jgi:hypothetical protein